MTSPSHPRVTAALRIVVASAVALGPTSSALASEPAPPTEDVQPSGPAGPAEPDPAIALARTHFDRGAASYEGGDYATAVAQWTTAYELMAGVPSLVAARRILAFDLGQAQMRAYDHDGDRSRLAAARPLLDAYVAWVDRPGHTMTEAEREDRPRAVELLARIAIEEGVAPVDPPRIAVPKVSPATAPPRPPTPRKPAGTGLIVSGSISLGVSAALGGVAAALAARGARLEDDYVRALESGDMEEADRIGAQGVRNNAGFIASAVSAGVLGAAGIGMVVGGAIRRHRSRSDRSVAIQPVVAPTVVGVGLRASF